jgi:hypothetical protein
VTTRHTEVAIDGEQFFINGQVTYPGRYWNGHRIEGLLFNSRMVQAIFDDMNAETRQQWAYADTGQWDAERNNREFIEAMPLWRDHGVLGLTLNLQGGNPCGYGSIDAQQWYNSAITPDGDLRPEYMTRLQRVLDRADELGMVIILGIFYFGQEKNLNGEAAIYRALDNAVAWLFEHDYRHVLIEVNNECNILYKQPLLRPEGVHELIQRVKAQTSNGRRLLVSTSYGGNHLPRANVVREADFILMHGNSVSHPPRIAEMVRQVRQVEGYRTMPVLFNEDDHFDFDKPYNNLLAAVSEYASWGYFDYRFDGEAYEEGFQSVPVDWGINSDRKRGFFNSVKAMTGMG